MSTRLFKVIFLDSIFIKKLVVLLLLLSSVAGISSEARVLKIALDDWCPYSCNPELEGGKEGYIADILSAVFSANGFRIESQQMTYSRLLDEVREGRYSVLTAMLKIDGGDYVFPSKPQGISRYSFYTLKGLGWRYDGLDSLFQLSSLVLVQDYAYNQLSVAMGTFVRKCAGRCEYISGQIPVERNFRKLLGGRIEAVLSDRFVAQYVIAKLGASGDIVEVGTPWQAVHVYAAFSAAIPSSEYLAHALVEGTEVLRQSGELDRILKKYNLDTNF